MSAIEQPARFRCVVSIAGVTDPLALGAREARYIGGRAAQAFIGFGKDLRDGSPIKRVDELATPVLLAHGKRDLNVPFTQSQSFARSLARAKKSVEFIDAIPVTNLGKVDKKALRARFYEVAETAR